MERFKQPENSIHHSNAASISMEHNRYYKIVLQLSFIPLVGVWKLVIAK